MKVFQYSDNYTSLQTLFLQLQLTLELSQIQEIISNYSDLLLFFAKYSFLFLEKTKVYESKKNNDSWLPSGQNSRVMDANPSDTIPTNKDWSGNEKRTIFGLSDLDYKEFEEKKDLAQLYDDKNQILAETLLKYLNVKYQRGGFSAEGIDCSGLLGRALADMGYNITRDDVQTGLLSSGEVDWFGLFPIANNKRTGCLGIINFYKVENSIDINHMNYGIGKNNTPIPLISPINQIIDATETDSMLIRNDGRPGQYFKAGEGQVNQTYAPFSSNTDVSIQGYVRWEILESNYRK